MQKTARSPRETGRTSLRTMLLSMAVVEMASGTTQQYLGPLLPGLGEKAGIATAGQNWIYVIQQISMAVLTPLLSRLGDMYGYRRVLRVSVLMVTAGSLIMALMPSTAGLTAGAALQGGLVGFMPLLIGILRSRTGREDSRRGIGLMVGALLVSIGAGGLISGQVGANDPAAGLWVGVVAGLLGVAACMLLPDGKKPGKGQHFDTRGFALLTAGLIGTVLAVAQGGSWGWTSPSTLLTGGLGTVALAAWVFTALRVPQPLIDVRIFTNLRVALLSVVTFCLSFSSIGTLTANVTFLAADADTGGYGFGLGPQPISLVLLMMVTFGFLSSNLTALALRRIGDRATVAAAGTCSAVGFTGLALFHGTLPGYLFFVAVNGAVMGIYQASTRTLIVEAVPEHEPATVAGVNELVLSYGSAIGSAAVGAVFAANPHGTSGHVTGTAYVTVWTVCAGLGLAAAGASLLLTPGREHPEKVFPTAA